MKHLIHLDLSHCSRINNAEIVRILYGLTSLKFLDLSSCNRISDWSLRALGGAPWKITGGKLELLREGGRKISLPMLEELHVAKCEYITEDGIAWLKSGCPKLERLNILGCTNIVCSSSLFEPVDNDDLWQDTWSESD